LYSFDDPVRRGVVFAEPHEHLVQDHLVDDPDAIDVGELGSKTLGQAARMARSLSKLAASSVGIPSSRPSGGSVGMTRTVRVTDAAKVWFEQPKRAVKDNEIARVVALKNDREQSGVVLEKTGSPAG